MAKQNNQDTDRRPANKRLRTEYLRLFRHILTILSATLIFFLGQKAYLATQSRSIAIQTLRTVLNEPDTNHKLVLLQYLESLEPDNKVLAKAAADAATFINHRKELKAKEIELASLRALRAQNDQQKARIQDLIKETETLRTVIAWRDKEIKERGCVPTGRETPQAADTTNRTQDNRSELEHYRRVDDRSSPVE